MKKWMILAGVLCCAQSMLSVAAGTELKYKDGDTELSGELFRDGAAEATRGGILVFHQWTGISDHEREVAKKLAGQGFVVLCADVYGTGIRPQAPDACKAEVAKYKGDRRLTRFRAAAALATLRAQTGIGSERPVVAIGYCFGGLCALEMARAGSDIRAAVSFHGALAAGEPAGQTPIRAKLLVLHGADDPYVPPAEVAAFRSEMQSAEADLRFIAYPGAVHSFTHRQAGADKSAGAAYDEGADRKSWIEFQKLLDEVAPGPAGSVRK